MMIECMIHSVDGQELLDIPDAAEYLGITAPAVSARIKSGTLPAVEYKRRKYIPLDAVLALKEKRDARR